MSKPQLSAIERQCLSIIAEHLRATGSLPSLRGIGVEMRLAKSHIHQIVGRLIRRGFLVQTGSGYGRGLALT